MQIPHNARTVSLGIICPGQPAQDINDRRRVRTQRFANQGVCKVLNGYLENLPGDALSRIKLLVQESVLNVR